MPIVDVSYHPGLSDGELRALAEVLPDAVSVAVECPEEPYDEALQPGDVNLRFHSRSPFDDDGLDVIVEVTTTWFASREADRHARADRIRDTVASALGSRSLGVYLTLPVAAWSQSS